MEHHENSFWKQNSKTVPGRPSPKKDYNQYGKKSGVGSTSFQDFQESVQDAWDMGDDEFCIISDAKISKKVSHSAALNVIKTHRINLGNSKIVNEKVHKSFSKNIQLSNNNITNTSTNSNITDRSSNKINENEQQAFNAIAVTSHNNTNNNTGSEMINKKTTENLQNDDNNYNVMNNNSTHQYQEQLDDARPRYRQIHAYPGRPQLLRFSSCLSRDIENETKIEKFRTLLDETLLNSLALKELSWSGIPKKMRAITWRLLSGYLPTSLERRNSVLERKRLDYHNLVTQYFKVDAHDENQQDTFRQIHIDVPRMNPHVQLFQQKIVQEMFERILFIWAIRHPASGYVQGINDLVTPFFIVFLQEAIETNEDLETFNMEKMSEDQRNIIEADSFWCLSKFLDCIQDNYIFAQLGIQAKVNQLKELIHRIDGTLHKQLQGHGVDYLQFSFRWMNNLLTRELPLHCTIRLWDTYLSESDGFAVFQLYVCAAFLLYWREQLLQEKDFQGLMLLLQNLPTHNWTDSHIGILVAEAYRLKFTYADAPKHLEGKS